MPSKLAQTVQHKVGATQVADTLTAGGAIGYGYRMLQELDIIVSIVAGCLVAVSAGFSIYLHWQEHKRRRAEEKDQSKSD